MKMKKKEIFWYKASTKRITSQMGKKRSYKINLSVEHQCYVYYLDQFFIYIFITK